MKTKEKREIEKLCDELIDKTLQLQNILSAAVPEGTEAVCLALAAADILADSLAQAATSDIAAQHMLYDIVCLLKSKVERFRKAQKRNKYEKKNNSL